MGTEATKENGHGRSEEACTGRTTDATAVVHFGIGGLLRFLSHAETLRVFERACVRAGVPVKYSQGFNPHPKLSLPLPRPVGVASDDELLVLRLFDAEGIPVAEGQDGARQAWEDRTKAALSAALPEGLVVHSVALMKSSVSFRPQSAQYVFDLDRADGRTDLEALRERIGDILARESVVVERVVPERQTGRRVDIRPFLKTMELHGTRAVVECRVGDAGSVRIDELMPLLELKPEDLSGPVRRTGIAWTITGPSNPPAARSANRDTK
ncbi:MAG TPA: TIGR03936 family radical SAM-associated protein [Sedimentisphaerales bacterium]|nr:TIGR03936 family radical SAM-associated protein [Sedimentisphaerales bacterium]HRS12524.1 TIGR03936 family radical SAM-associated protein [Sedimentisphaerales bacterium]HRV49162.1 TIGR03936 family radical SAM-associated protein [Sedimentisphaerales bacterium]